MHLYIIPSTCFIIRLEVDKKHEERDIQSQYRKAAPLPLR